MQAMGASVNRIGDGAWSIRGVGVGGFAEPAAPLDFGNSGTGCRLVMGAVAGCPITAVFDGDASLRKRPMRRILDPLEKIGARDHGVRKGGRLPVRLQGARDPLPIGMSAGALRPAQVCRAARGPRGPRRHHGDREGSHPGPHRKDAASISALICDVTAEGEHGRRITLEGQPELEGASVVVPADPSSAAFPLVAALIVPGSELILEGVMMNPLRTGLLTTLKEMGASSRSSPSATRAARTSLTCASEPIR